MSEIIHVKAREILDSRGNPTVEAEVVLESGVMGRAAGTLPGFAYSEAMAASGIVWSKVTLEPYLLSPKTVVPNNKMMFNGIKRAGEMEDLLEYLSVATQ